MGVRVLRGSRDALTAPSVVARGCPFAGSAVAEYLENDPYLLDETPFEDRNAWNGEEHPDIAEERCVPRGSLRPAKVPVRRFEQMESALLSCPLSSRFSRISSDWPTHRDMMEGRVNANGKVLRDDGMFPFKAMDLVGGGPTFNGYTEKDLLLDECCAVPKPNLLTEIYDLFASGSFFMN